jgi:protein-S-isoprenylcysteine O-methyltransferase Ste14
MAGVRPGPPSWTGTLEHEDEAQRKRSVLTSRRPDLAGPRPTIRNPLRQLIHVPVPWVFVLTYVLGVALQTLRPYPVSPDALRLSNLAGAVLFAIGAGIAGWGWLIFRRARTTTVPGRASSQLVTWGPYRVSRNPMYVGLALAYIGEAGLLAQVWPLLLLPLTIGYLNWIVIPVEEQRLMEVFQGEYERYRANVRRWI